MTNDCDKLIFTYLPEYNCLQCFDTVGWASGRGWRASGL